MKIDEKCRICRRQGVKLFLKGERCFSSKCPMIRKPYPPGQKGKKRRKPPSEYGKELTEKQKLKHWYNLKDRQFQNYVREILTKRGRVEDAASQLIQKLERRLDNTVFRLGFASSRAQARQLVSHRHFLVNNRVVNTSSFLVKKGDKIKIRPSSTKKAMFQNLPMTLKKYTPPSWLSVSIEKLEGEVKDLPRVKEVLPPVEISSIFELYSR